MEWIGCICCKKSRWDFAARSFALIALVHPVLHRVPCRNETIPNAPKHYAMHQIMSLGSNGGGSGVFGVQWDFIAQTCPLIAPVQPIVHRVSCSNETIQNAPKHYEMQQIICLRSNGVYRVRSLRKIPTRLHGTELFH